MRIFSFTNDNPIDDDIVQIFLIVCLFIVLIMFIYCCIRGINSDDESESESSSNNKQRTRFETLRTNIAEREVVRPPSDPRTAPEKREAVYQA